MPIYDYIYGTIDKSSNVLYEYSLKKKEDLPDVVHLTHMTTPKSIYHMQIGFAAMASRPYSSKWYLWLMWPVTAWSMILAMLYGRTFVVERHTFDKLIIQTWAIPKYKKQVSIKLIANHNHITIKTTNNSIQNLLSFLFPIYVAY